MKQIQLSGAASEQKQVENKGDSPRRKELLFIPEVFWLTDALLLNVFLSDV